MKLATAFVEVRPDTKAFRGDLEKQTTDDAKAVGSKLGAALAGGVFLAGAKRATDAASQLQQAVGGTAAVFGESARAVDDWAKGAAEGAGLSERAARELTSTLGGLLKGFGFTTEEAAGLSTQLAGLGADLAATFGGKPEEAVQALGAALRGETDPLERFGIALNQTLVNQKAVELGLAATTGAVDQHAKAQATLALITERSADAQGQFARESDTAAGQAAISAAKTENAAADLGENLLPIYTKISEVVGTVADAFGSLPEPVQTAIIALAGIAALSGPVKIAAEAIGTLATIARTALAGGLDKAAVGAYNLAGSLGSVAAVAGPLALIAAGLAIHFSENAKEAAEADAAVRGFKDAITEAGNATDGTRQAVAAFVQEDAGLAELLSKTGTSIDDVAAALTGSQADFDRFKESLIDQANAAGVSDQALATAAFGMDALRDASGKAADQADTTASALGDYGTAAGDAVAPTSILTQSIEDQEAALQGLLDATLAQFDANIGYRQSIDEVQDNLAELTTLTAEGKTGTEEYSDALLTTEQSLLDQAAAAVRMADDTAKANGQQLTANQRTAIYRTELAKLRDGLAPGSPLRKALDGYIAQLNNVPSSVSTDLILNFPTSQRAARQQDSRFGGLRSNAAGNTQVPDGIFTVGEHEPEVMVKRGDNLQVLAGTHTTIGGGMTNYFTIVAPDVDNAMSTASKRLRHLASEVGNRA